MWAEQDHVTWALEPGGAVQRHQPLPNYYVRALGLYFKLKFETQRNIAFITSASTCSVLRVSFKKLIKLSANR